MSPSPPYENRALQQLEHGIPTYTEVTSYEEIHMAAFAMVMEAKCPTCGGALALAGWCSRCRQAWSVQRIDQHTEIRLETRNYVLRWTMEPRADVP